MKQSNTQQYKDKSNKDHSHKKKLLLDGEDDNNAKDKFGGFKINEQFAKKFEHNERRKHLEKAKEKYGEKALLEDAEESSEEQEEEDDEGDLVNPKLEKKFLETIAMIRNNDPKLKEIKDELFKDEDFEEDDDDEEDDKEKSRKPFTYKDQIRKDVMNKQMKGEDAEEESSEEEGELFKKRSNKETVVEEERRLKSEFKKAGKVDEESVDEEEDDFLKKKSASEDEEEDEIPENIEKVGLATILNNNKKKKEMKLVTDTEILQRFYGDESKLDPTDKFLRNYILLECWKDKKKSGNHQYEKVVDKEDEQRDEEMDAFEQQYNFRFEEGNGAYLTTHQRKVEDSMRRKDDKRKDKRQEKKDRLDEEKRKKQEEINKLKQMKKEEIIEKLKKAEFLSGSKIVEDKKLLEKVEKELKTEFIPELYDRAMEKMFDEKYYNQNDKITEKAVKNKKLDMKLMNDQIEIDEDEMEEQDNEEGEEEGNEDEDMEDYDEEEEEHEDGEASNQAKNEDLEYERELAKSLKKQIQKQEEQEAQQGYETWYVCDGCTKPIEGGEYRFDCLTCDNFTFCEKCYKKNKTHLHKFNRAKVPPNQKPPKNNKELIEKAYMLCHQCGECLLDYTKTVYVCHTCSSDFEQGDIVYFCLKCKKTDEHEHKLSKLKVLPGQTAAQPKDKENMTEEEKNQYLESLLDDYYNLDFEDLIGGGTVKTRFKYRKVLAEDFGLTEDELLLLDDTQLNRLVSLRNYRAYNDMVDEQDNKKSYKKEFKGVNLHRVKNLKRTYEKELTEKKKMLKQSLVQNLEQEKEKFFKKGNKSDKQQQEDQIVSKNKKRKEKRINKGLDEREDNEGDEKKEDGEEIVDSKRKRLALYGIKQ